MPEHNSIGLLSAVPFESDLLCKSLTHRRSVDTFTLGRLGGNQVVHTTMGIGMVNAAARATELILRYKPLILIVFGIGGAYPSSGLSIGDMAIASSEIYADLGAATSKGLLDLNDMGFELFKRGRRKYYNELPLDTRLVQRVSKLLPGSITGRFATVNQATGTLRRAKELGKKLKVICENMEGAATVHVALLYGLKVLEIRGISNIVEDRDLSKWNKDLAARNVQEAVMEIINSI